MDRMNGDKIVNDSTIVISSASEQIIDLTAQFTMKNNTDKLLSLNLRKTVHFMADSTIDYFCFGVQCWPSTDTTNYPDTIQPGAEDYTFASHVVHFRRFEMPPLPFGKSSITYTIYDDTSYPETIEASVTVIYDHRNELGFADNKLPKAKVFPNPAKNQLSLQFEVHQMGLAHMKIYNNKGVIVKTMLLNLDGATCTFSIEDLATGSYFGKVESTQTTPLLFRFVK